MFAPAGWAIYFPRISAWTRMVNPVSRRRNAAPNGGCDGDIALLLERVCSRLPHDYTRQLVRDVVRLKLEMGFDGEVRDYLKRRSGEHAAVPTGPPGEKA